LPVKISFYPASLARIPAFVAQLAQPEFGPRATAPVFFLPGDDFPAKIAAN